MNIGKQGGICDVFGNFLSLFDSTMEALFRRFISIALTTLYKEIDKRLTLIQILFIGIKNKNSKVFLQCCRHLCHFRWHAVSHSNLLKAHKNGISISEKY